MSEVSSEAARKHQRLLEQLNHQKRARELLIPTDVSFERTKKAPP